MLFVLEPPALATFHTCHALIAKPEPLGTELKVTNTTTIGVGLYLEIQKGCEAMADAEFVSDMKKRQPVVAEWQRVQ